MFPCEECAAKERETELLPPGEIPVEGAVQDEVTETQDLSTNTQPLEVETAELGADTVALEEHSTEPGEETAVLDDEGNPYCPQCRVVLGSLIPCAACEAKGVRSVELDSGRGLEANPFLDFQEEELEIEEAGFTIAGLDDWGRGLLVVIAILFVLYQGLAWAARGEPKREMPKTAIVVGEAEARPARGPKASQGELELRAAIKLLRAKDYLGAQRGAEVARDLLIAERATPQAEAEAHHVIALSLSAQGNLTQSLRALEKAASLDPTNLIYQSKLQSLRGHVQEISGEQHQAALEAAVGELRKAQGLIQQREFTSAEKLITEVIPELAKLEVSPELSAQAWGLLAAASLGQGKTEEARQRLKQAYKLHPDPSYKQALEALEPGR